MQWGSFIFIHPLQVKKVNIHSIHPWQVKKVNIH